MKLGEQIINLHGTDFTSGESETVKNVHYAATHANGKPCRLAGFSIDGAAAPMIPVNLIDEDGTITGVADFGTKTLTVAITSEDAVTITISE